jgi:hypothetical protein
MSGRIRPTISGINCGAYALVQTQTLQMVCLTAILWNCSGPRASDEHLSGLTDQVGVNGLPNRPAKFAFGLGDRRSRNLNPSRFSVC